MHQKCEMFRANDTMNICNYPKNDRNSCEKLFVEPLPGIGDDVRVPEVKFYKLEWTRQVECKLWMVVKSRGVKGWRFILPELRSDMPAIEVGMRVDRGSKWWLVGCYESGFRTDYVTRIGVIRITRRQRVKKRFLRKLVNSPRKFDICNEKFVSR